MTIENFISRVTNDKWNVTADNFKDPVSFYIYDANVTVIENRITITYQKNASMSFPVNEINSVNEDGELIIVDVGGLTFVFEESIF